MQSQADGSTRRPRRPFRKDIEGLRAVAILAVVLYHAHVGAVPGGYVGVDVFFVISGYLITDHLWREVHDSHGLSFRGFYARRIRRLLPASFLVLAVTAVASAAILPPLTARAVLKDGVACALYVGNYRFALLQTNYLTASAAPSPFQNYWSLGVEEQFYLVWPAVLLLASLAWSRRRHVRPSRASATIALGVIAVTSCAFSIWLTHASEPWAFFSLGTRAWELAVGGLIALGAPAIGRMRGRPLLGWVGLGLVVWSIVTYTSSTPFPGTAALVPVLGTAAIIAAGSGPAPLHGPVQILRRPPMLVIGRVSYSWYLWHWPMLILVPAALGHPLSLAAEPLGGGLELRGGHRHLRPGRTSRPDVELAHQPAPEEPQPGRRPHRGRRRCLRPLRAVAAEPHRNGARAGGGGRAAPVDQGAGGGLVVAVEHRPGAAPRGHRRHSRTGRPFHHGPGRAGEPRTEPPRRQCGRATRLRRRMPRQLHRYVTAALHLRRHQFEHQRGALRRLPRGHVVPGR